MSKNIYKDFVWEDYEMLLQNSLDDGIHIVHNFDTNNPFGGQTFVWARESQFKKSRMIRVSIAWCNPKDQFCKKIGTYNALFNWYEKGESILLPVGDEDSAVVVRRLRQVFNHIDFIKEFTC